MTDNTFATDWARKWTQGTVAGYAKGSIELPRALGMLKTSRKILSDEEVDAIIESVRKNPVYVDPNNSEQTERFEKLLKSIEAQ